MASLLSSFGKKAVEKAASTVASKLGNVIKTKEGNTWMSASNSNLNDYSVLKDVRAFTDNNSESGITSEHVLKTYQDWRAILRIAPITNVNYLKRNKLMFGDAQPRTHRDKNGQTIIDDDTNGFLRILTEVGGILFPYTPIINVSGKSNWQKQQIVHSNINYYSWENSEPEEYDVTGDFTASNPSEALYCLAIFNFLRTITKGSGPNAAGNYNEVLGASPPVLYFSAYGNGMIQEVPVVINSYSYSLGKDVDYVELILDPQNNWQPVLDKTDRFNNTDMVDYVISRVPTKFTLSIKLLTNINPAKYRKFSLWDYKNGAYIKQTGKYGINTGWTW